MRRLPALWTTTVLRDIFIVDRVQVVVVLTRTPLVIEESTPGVPLKFYLTFMSTSLLVGLLSGKAECSFIIRNWRHRGTLQAECPCPEKMQRN